MNRTLLFGEGLFETIKWKGESKKLNLHYERLKSSADFFDIPCPSYDEFVNDIRRACGKLTDIYVKFCLFSAGGSTFYEKPLQYSSQIIVKQLPKPPNEISLDISQYRRHSKNPLWRHKTMNYMFNIIVKRNSIKKDMYDSVILNENDYITECSSSNLVIAKKDKLFTPAKETGLLWGTTLEILHQRFDIKEEYLKVTDLIEAESILMLNSIIGAVCVNNFAGHRKYINAGLLNQLNSEIEKW